MELLEVPNKTITCALIKKIPNINGSFNVQYKSTEQPNRILICKFISYEQAVSYFYLECNLKEEKHFKESVQMWRK